MAEADPEQEKRKKLISHDYPSILLQLNFILIVISIAKDFAEPLLANISESRLIWFIFYF